MTKETCRFDLDDLGGEVVLLDFSRGTDINVTTYQESFASRSTNLRNRITPLHKHEFLIPLTPDAEDPILGDIQTIPRALDRIQSQWKEGGLNRMTAWNLGRQLRKRLQAKVAGEDDGSIDILVTGCEVSLYLAEQFASDLQKSFPKLRIQAISSNKLLGMFGQELAVPSIGFPLSSSSPDLRKSVVLICSHSGGTFGPLAISNLLQSVTKNIFVIASEWDTQIGKQLRAIYNADTDIFGSRVFSTDIGVRPSEPCSLSVCATHQLLTQIFEHLCLVILNELQFRSITGAVITEQDLRVLERCNQDNILALERIIGFTAEGNPHDTEVQRELQVAGALWAEHVLENARAYIMSFFYIVLTVTIGYPLITGIAVAAGMTAEYGFYITRFFDSLIYFFLPQINVTLIRLFQKRNLLHRMTGRTVVIGDIPWVSQCADAFLSKIFARSYSIASLNVLSGNPSDHLVHRHTHRVVRGTLLICGRPDGRLTALTSAECSVNLSVNQASSIQSLGGTCESITIGHNPSKLALTKMDIALGTHRPKFLCEQLLDVMDEDTRRKRSALTTKLDFGNKSGKKRGCLGRLLRGTFDDHDSDSIILNRSSHSLKGAYLGFRDKSDKDPTELCNGSNSDSEGKRDQETVDTSAMLDMIQQSSKEDRILQAMIAERNKTSELRRIFHKMDSDGNGTIDLDEFIDAYKRVNPDLSVEDITTLFLEGKDIY
jgi:Ca2+-binding EF-hand superfamily protein